MYMTHHPNPIPPPPERTEPSSSAESARWNRVSRVFATNALALALPISWISFLLTPARPSGGVNPIQVMVLFVVIIIMIWAVVALSALGTPIRLVFVILAGSFLLFVSVFSQLYWDIGETTNFGGTDLSKLDAVYFALGTLTTAGTGNLSATSELSRSLVAVQMVLDIGLTGFAVTVVAARLSERPRTPPATAPSNPPRSSS